jgi:hypothetical protein
MKKSKLFFTDRFENVERKIRKFLNQQKSFMSVSTAKSTRAVGDAIQDILSENFVKIIGKSNCKNYSADFARRAMADLAFEDNEGFYYRIDVKTHRLSTHFNMPNLTSVERLATFYEDDRNYFVILMVVYDIEDVAIKVKNVHFVPIEFLDWDCLTIGALGWGQIQIANSNRVVIKHRYSRKQWMLQMCNILIEHFYPGEVLKIDKRISRFQRVKKFWENHPD